ncbi:MULTISPECIES: hypothetical protein [unclassified Crossiella]|uniref:hypothetical protein n=1 Tax=Crossiella sp. SN42 TaxID=2944808 RepID=UPI00207CB03D|nr:hypothetical protein [Crossiella sp. SN42]MCO1578232.1 hypothetical protein [Crossiella sp. SN42]
MSEFIVLGIGILGGLALLAIALLRRGERRDANPAAAAETGHRPGQTETALGGYKEYFGGP